MSGNGYDWFDFIHLMWLVVIFIVVNSEQQLIYNLWLVFERYMITDQKYTRYTCYFTKNSILFLL